jgi:DNA-binding CsgD family transcriptional regulator
MARTSSPSGSFALLETLLVSGLDVMSQMPIVSEALKEVVPSFSLSMIRVDERCAPRHHYSEHFDETSHRLFADSGHVFAAASDDPAAFGNLLRPRRRAVGTLIEGGDALVNGGTYQHLFQRNGIHHVLDVAIRDQGGPLGILGIFREKKARRFDARDVQSLERLYPWLVHAFAAHRATVRGGRDEAACGLLAYDEVDSAMIVANDRGTIQWASERALSWLEDASAGADRVQLMASPSRLPEACVALCKEWNAGRRTRGSLRGGASVPTLTLAVPGGRLRLRAYGLAAQLDGANDGGLVGIQLSLEMSRGLRVVTALERSKLTPQQRRIALGLWMGHSPKEIAARIGVSASTLKSYQKALYVRLDVNSAADVVRKLDRQARAVTFDLGAHLPAADGRGS